jgi:hypothetical protein
MGGSIIMLLQTFLFVLGCQVLLFFLHRIFAPAEKKMYLACQTSQKLSKMDLDESTSQAIKELMENDTFEQMNRSQKEAVLQKIADAYQEKTSSIEKSGKNNPYPFIIIGICIGFLASATLISDSLNRIVHSIVEGWWQKILLVLFLFGTGFLFWLLDWAIASTPSGRKYQLRRDAPWYVKHDWEKAWKSDMDRLFRNYEPTQVEEYNIEGYTGTLARRWIWMYPFCLF